MSFYITQYVGSGTDDDPYRPKGVDGLDEWSSIDLSPDGTKGDVLVSVPQSLSVAEGTDLIADEPLGTMPLLVRNKLGNRLGVTLSGSRFKDIAAELLIDHAREDGTRWKPIKPEKDGALRVYLGGLLWEMLPVRGGSSIADDFNRANNADISASAPFGWTDQLGNLIISSNAVIGNTLNATHASRADVDLDSGDHYAEVTVVSSSGGGTTTRTEPGVFVRQNATATLTNYRLQFIDIDAANTGWQVKKSVSGTITTLAELLNVAVPSTPFVIRGEANGSTIRVLEGLTEKVSVTDTAISGTGRLRTGIKTTYGGSANKEPIDNFGAGDLGASVQTVSPGFITNTPVLYAPRIDQQVQVGLIANTPTVYAPTIAEEVPGDQTVSPGVIENAPVLHAPQINQSVVIGLISNTPTLFAPTVNQTVEIGLINNAPVVYEPRIDQSVAIGLIENIANLFHPTINQQVRVGIIENPSTVYAPTITDDGPQTVSVGLISHGHQVYAPSITQFWVREAGTRPRRGGTRMPRRQNRRFDRGRDTGR